MSTRLLITRGRRLSAVVVAIAFAVSAATGAAGRSSSALAAQSREFRGESEGTAVQLPPPATVGQSATISLTINSTSAGAAGDGTLAVHMAMSRQVAAVDTATGAYTTRSHVASLEVAQAPAGFDVAPLDSLDGASISQSFASTGTALSPPNVEDAASESQVVGGRQLVDWLAITSVGFPAEPVAVGASWTSPGTAPIGGGVSVGVVYQCRLTSVEAQQYTVEISYAAGFTVAGTALGQIDGDISGQGTLIGLLDNPLVLSGRVNQVIDAIATAGGTTSQLRATSAIDMRGTG